MKKHVPIPKFLSARTTHKPFVCTALCKTLCVFLIDDGDKRFSSPSTVTEPRKVMQLQPTIRKLPVDSVTYGKDISLNGRWVWGAYDGERLVVVGATVKEAKRKYRAVWHEKWVTAGMVRSNM